MAARALKAKEAALALTQAAVPAVVANPTIIAAADSSKSSKVADLVTAADKPAAVKKTVVADKSAAVEKIIVADKPAAVENIIVADQTASGGKNVGASAGFVAVPKKRARKAANGAAKKTTAAVATKTATALPANTGLSALRFKYLKSSVHLWTMLTCACLPPAISGSAALCPTCR